MHLSVILIMQQHIEQLKHEKNLISCGRVDQKIYQYFGRLGQKKCEKMTWSSCPGRVGFGRIDCTPLLLLLLSTTWGIASFKLLTTFKL